MNIRYSLLFATLIIGCNSNSKEKKDDESNLSFSSKLPELLYIKSVNSYPHDTNAFTQGLQFYKGLLYEGTGDYVNSSLRLVDLKSGRVLKKNIIGTSILFGEGITIFKEKLYQLTWRNNIVYVYNINNIMNPIKTFKWPKEGWGVTNDGVNIIISDGSSWLYFVDAETFQIVRKIQVLKGDNTPFEKLNELEYIKGFIYANVFEENIIAKIDPLTGNVSAIIDCTEIIRENNLTFKYNPEKVLNGIAWDSISDRMFITGKLWPVLFEIKLTE